MSARKMPILGIFSRDEISAQTDIDKRRIIDIDMSNTKKLRLGDVLGCAFGTSFMQSVRSSQGPRKFYTRDVLFTTFKKNSAQKKGRRDFPFENSRTTETRCLVSVVLEISQGKSKGRSFGKDGFGWVEIGPKTQKPQNQNPK